ncbi:MAG: hypothetical protein K8S25_00945 [Alphaproteobacteria bacterium]|nr:hypothetical protein [Alphaproteobacteria bacterium]
MSAMVIAGLSSGGCGLLRPSVTLTPIGISRVSVDEMPAQIRGLPHNGAALRIDFYSTPELLSEDIMYVTDNVRLCDASDPDELLRGMPSPFFGEKEIFSPRHREEARALVPQRRDTSTHFTYSTYVYISHTEEPGSPGSRYHPGYDLAKHPRPLCVAVELYNGPHEVSRTTNTMAFSAEQIAAALRSKR